MSVRGFGHRRAQSWVVATVSEWVRLVPEFLGPSPSLGSASPSSKVLKEVRAETRWGTTPEPVKVRFCCRLFQTGQAKSDPSQPLGNWSGWAGSLGGLKDVFRLVLGPAGHGLHREQQDSEDLAVDSHSYIQTQVLGVLCCRGPLEGGWWRAPL